MNFSHLFRRKQLSSFVLPIWPFEMELSAKIKQFDFNLNSTVRLYDLSITIMIIYSWSSWLMISLRLYSWNWQKRRKLIPLNRFGITCHWIDVPSCLTCYYHFPSAKGKTAFFANTMWPFRMTGMLSVDWINPNGFSAQKQGIYGFHPSWFLFLDFRIWQNSTFRIVCRLPPTTTTAYLYATKGDTSQKWNGQAMATMSLKMNDERATNVFTFDEIKIGKMNFHSTNLSRVRPISGTFICLTHMTIITMYGCGAHAIHSNLCVSSRVCTTAPCRNDYRFVLFSICSFVRIVSVLGENEKGIYEWTKGLRTAVATCET